MRKEKSAKKDGHSIPAIADGMYRLFLILQTASPWNSALSQLSAKNHNNEHNMKHLSLIVFAVLCTACVSHRVWEQPAVLHADKNIEVRAIEFHSDSTVVHFTASGRPGSTFRLKENVYLIV